MQMTESCSVKLKRISAVRWIVWVLRAGETAFSPKPSLFPGTLFSTLLVRSFIQWVFVNFHYVPGTLPGPSSISCFWLHENELFFHHSVRYSQPEEAKVFSSESQSSKVSFGLARWLSGSRCLRPSLTTWVQSQGGRRRLAGRKGFSHLHIQGLACGCCSSSK